MRHRTAQWRKKQESIAALFISPRRRWGWRNNVEEDILQCWAPPANPIMQVEFLAVLVGLLCSWQKLAGRDVIWFIDSTSALAAAIKGSSPDLDVDSMTQLLNILPYVGNIRFWWGLLSAVRSRARVWRQVRPRARVFGCCTRPLGPRPLGARMSRWRTSASASGGGICPRRRALEVRRRPLGRPPAPPMVRCLRSVVGPVGPTARAPRTRGAAVCVC